MSKESPIHFLIIHREAVMAAYNENTCKPGKTWDCLLATLPELSKAMSLNTFKQYMSVLAVFNRELDRVTQDKEQVVQKLHNVTRQRDEVTHKLYKLEHEKSELETQSTTPDSRLAKVTQLLDLKPEVAHNRVPKRIDGWSVQKAKDGYYRCYRKIDKKLHSVYIGKTFDVEKARGRVAEKERSLGLYNSCITTKNADSSGAL